MSTEAFRAHIIHHQSPSLASSQVDTSTLFSQGRNFKANYSMVRISGEKKNLPDKITLDGNS